MKSFMLATTLLAACSASPNWSSAKAIDGDTFVASGTHYRLARIDAPEMPGHCRKGRRCVAGDPYAAKRALQWYLDRGVACQEQGIDFYGRTLVECRRNTILTVGGGKNIGDALMEFGYAEQYRRSPRP